MDFCYIFSHWREVNLNCDHCWTVLILSQSFQCLIKGSVQDHSQLSTFRCFTVVLAKMSWWWTKLSFPNLCSHETFSQLSLFSPALLPPICSHLFSYLQTPDAFQILWSLKISTYTSSLISDAEQKPHANRSGVMPLFSFALVPKTIT